MKKLVLVLALAFALGSVASLAVTPPVEAGCPKHNPRC